MLFLVKGLECTFFIPIIPLEYTYIFIEQLRVPIYIIYQLCPTDPGSNLAAQMELICCPMFRSVSAQLATKRLPAVIPAYGPAVYQCLLMSTILRGFGLSSPSRLLWPQLNMGEIRASFAQFQGKCQHR